MTDYDPVSHPTHYQSNAKCSGCNESIECIDVVRHHDFNRGNAIKYLWRAGAKGDTVQDLKKAIWYIQDEIAQLEGVSNPNVHKLSKPEITNYIDGSICLFTHPTPFDKGGYDFLCVTHNYHMMTRTGQAPDHCQMYVEKTE